MHSSLTADSEIRWDYGVVDRLCEDIGNYMFVIQERQIKWTDRRDQRHLTQIQYTCLWAYIYTSVCGRDLFKKDVEIVIKKQASFMLCGKLWK